jgi:hypothetical protein
VAAKLTTPSSADEGNAPTSLIASETLEVKML